MKKKKIAKAAVQGYIAGKDAPDNAAETAKRPEPENEEPDSIPAAAESPKEESIPKGNAEKKAKSRSSGLLHRRKKAKDDTFSFRPGATTLRDILAPASANLTNKNYVVVDGVFHAYLYITGYGYSTTVGNGWLAPLVEAGEGVNLNFTIRRIPKEKILPKIAQATMVNRSRMRDVGDTRQDYEEIDSAISSGLYLKDAMNRSSEEFYYMHTIIEVTADDADTLEQRAGAVETLCTSVDLFCRRCDYRHREAFLSCLPVLQLDPDIERKSKRNALTSGVAAAFPFSSYEICDQTGILLGINQHNRSVCMPDIFDAAKYSNANMFIMGMSGAGKTFLLQLIALRFREQRTRVIIIAPLKGFEFRPLCEAVGGKYIKLSPSSPDCINIMEIRRTTLDVDSEIRALDKRDDSLLADKIATLHVFFSLLKTLTEEEKSYLDTVLVDCYARFGITFDNDSIFHEDGSRKTRPALSDLYEDLQEHPETKAIAVSLHRFVKGSAASLGKETNVDLDNPYIVIDISESPKDLRNLIMFIATSTSWDICKSNLLEKTVLMLDELWNLIGASSNPMAADYVLEIFKIIRGLGGAALGSTQDLSDCFALQDGKYGKAILNACRTKIVLQLEEDEAKTVQKYLALSDEETMQVIRNQRGQGLLCIGENRIGVTFHSSRKEYDLITTSRADLQAQAEQRKVRNGDKI